MRFFLVVIFLALPFGPSVIAQTQALEPIAQWERKTPKWASDPSELGYISVRCGALFGVIGTAFSNLGSKSGDTKTGNEVTARGVLLVMFGNQASESTGWSKAKLEERFNAISGSYLEIVSKNRTAHNNMFHGFIENDWKFCLELEGALKSLANRDKR